MSFFDELALAYAGRFGALESARHRPMEQREGFLREVRALVDAVAAPAPGLRLVRAPKVQEDNHWAHWHFRWTADGAGRIVYVSCWFPGRWGGDAKLVCVATLVCDGPDAALSPLSSSMIEDLRSLANAPGEAPRVDHDPTGVKRQTLRLRQFAISEAMPKQVAEEVLDHLRYTEQVVAHVELALDVPWAVRQISNAVEPTLQTLPVGWAEYSGSNAEDFWAGVKGQGEGSPWVYLSAGISGIWWVVEDPDGVAPGAKGARSKRVREVMPMWVPDAQESRQQVLLTLDQVRQARKDGDTARVELQLRSAFERL
jgi:hypothetical protein